MYSFDKFTSLIFFVIMIYNKYYYPSCLMNSSMNNHDLTKSFKSKYIEGIVYSLAMCHIRVCKKTWKYCIHFAIIPLGLHVVVRTTNDNFLSYYVPIQWSIINHYFMSMSNLILININIMNMKRHMLIFLFHIHVGG
jgi:hypothetical protein